MSPEFEKDMSLVQKISKLIMFAFLAVVVVFGVHYVVLNTVGSFGRVLEARNGSVSERDETITEPQERQITLSDGREVLCLVWPNINSSCDWENAK